MVLESKTNVSSGDLITVLSQGSGAVVAYLQDTAENVRTVLEDGLKRLPPIQGKIQNLSTMAAAIGEIAVNVSRSSVQSAIDSVFKKWEEARTDAGAVEKISAKKMVIWLVHPTNYRRDGTPRKWKKQILPANAIGQIKALIPEKLMDGSDAGLPIECHVLEDTVQPFDINRIVNSMNGENVTGAVMFCGVQTNQWVRAMDLASLCREKNIPVIMGGYHVRADLPYTAMQAREIGISLAIGEAESVEASGRPFLEGILQDLAKGELRPEYRQRKNPDMEDQTLSEVLPEYQELMHNPTMATLETSRGCPMPCSFCTIRTIGGREVRARSPKKMKSWLKKIYTEQGIRSIFITDDNFSKNGERFEVLKMLEDLRNEGTPLNIMIQADTQATKGESGRRFLDACRRAGVYSVFLGIESVDPDTLKAMNKPQNNPATYKEITDAWHSINVITQCGFIIGSSTDTLGTGKRSAQSLIEMGIDIAAAYVLTPLPGSVDYHDFHQRGFVKNTDFNLYDSHSEACLEFPGGLTREQVMREYQDFFDEFFAFRNLPRLADNLKEENLKIATRQWIWYKYANSKGDHPMYSGLGEVSPDYVRTQFQKRAPSFATDLAPGIYSPGTPFAEKPKRRLPLINDGVVLTHQTGAEGA